MLDSWPCDWLVLPFLLPNPTIVISDGVGTDSSDSEFPRAYDFTYDSDFGFSLDRKPFYDFDSGSVVSDNQPLGRSRENFPVDRF